MVASMRRLSIYLITSLLAFAIGFAVWMVSESYNAGVRSREKLGRLECKLAAEQSLKERLKIVDAYFGKRCVASQGRSKEMERLCHKMWESAKNAALGGGDGPPFR